MATTILYSAVDSVSAGYPQPIAEMQAFFAHYQVPVGSPEALREIAGRLRLEPEFHDDLLSMLSVIRLSEGEISTLEVLAVLLVAATGVTEAALLGHRSPAEDAAARELFQFVTSSTRLGGAGGVREAGDAVDGSAPAMPREETAEEPSRLSGTPVAERNHVYQGAGLSRALALSADEEEPFQEPAAPVRTRRTRVGQRALEDLSGREAPSPLHDSETSIPEPASAHRWLYGACGVLLGVLLGFFVERQRPVPVPQSVPGSSASMPKEDTWDSAPLLPAARPHGGASPMHDGKHPRGAKVPVVPEAETASVRSPAVVPSTKVGARPSSALSAFASRPGRVGSGAGSTAGSGLAKRLPLGPATDEASSAPSPAGGGSGRVTVGTAGIMAANVLSSPTPTYPVQASAAAVQGEVVVEAIVGREGDVIDTRVVSGPLLLREAALQAVQQWHYRPYEVDGKPVEIATTARFEFRLGR